MGADADLFECIRAYKRSRVLTFAIECGALSAIGLGSVLSSELAQRLAVSLQWLQPVLNVLVDLGLLCRQGGRYSLTPRGIAAETDPALRAFAGYHHYCFGAWMTLAEAAKFGKGQDFHRRALADPHVAAAYVRSMDAIAISHLSFLAERCAPALTGKVLDIGAGPATLTRRLASTRGVQVVAMDLPEIIEASRSLFGEPRNFRWEPADFFAYRPQASFDAAFCSHFLEYCPEGQLAHWLGHIRECLVDAGHLVALAFLRGRQPAPEPDLDLFELSTGLNGPHLGHLCSEEEMRGHLEDAGFSAIAIDGIPRSASYDEFLITCQKG